MANEQQVTIRYQVTKGNFVDKIDPGVIQYDQATGRGGSPGVVAATTTWAAVSFGAVSPGYVYLRNTSTGATVQLRTTSGGIFAEFTPNKMALVPFGVNTWQVRASTAGGTSNVVISGYST